MTNGLHDMAIYIHWKKVVKSEMVVIAAVTRQGPAYLNYATAC
jgi:hypothetical protein